MTTTSVAVEQAIRTVQDLPESLNMLRQKMIEDYNRSGFTSTYDIVFEFGKKYVRIVHLRGQDQRSCAGFVICDNKHKEFALGTLLKAASWKAPATNKARGNVFELEGKQIAWTGIQ